MIRVALSRINSGGSTLPFANHTFFGFLGLERDIAVANARNSWLDNRVVVALDGYRFLRNTVRNRGIALCPNKYVVAALQIAYINGSLVGGRTHWVGSRAEISSAIENLPHTNISCRRIGHVADNFAGVAAYGILLGFRFRFYTDIGNCK